MSASSQVTHQRRPIRGHLRALLMLAAAVLLAAACTEPSDNGVRSPAPTGSLTPATSAEASTSP